GGNAGILGVSVDDYLNALDAFEGVVFNVLTLDDVSNEALQASIKAWVERVREEGKKILAVMGGSADDDKDPAVGNARSREFNHEAVINVIVGGVLNGVSYSSAEIAPYVASLI